jgi:hypothetical protein
MAQGLSGRKLRSIPATALEALAAPQSTAYELLNLPETATAKQVWQAFQVQAATLAPERRFELAARLYGREAAALELTALLLSYPARWLGWAVCKLQAGDLRIVTWAAGFPEIDTETFPAPDKRPARVVRAGLDKRNWFFN